MCGATNQSAIPRRPNSGDMTHTQIHAALRYWRTRVFSRAAIDRDSTEVSPVDSPTHSAIITNSSGTTRPIAATASSPMVAA